MDARICPRYERAAMLLGKKWTGLMLRILMDGPRRFSDFRAHAPQLSDRIVSERLQELEREGLVERIVHPSKPVAVEYRLTAKGRGLEPVVQAIQAWADRWIEMPAADSVCQASATSSKRGA
jgi:DNA-binding HxlR family transcriptional regulator